MTTLVGQQAPDFTTPAVLGNSEISVSIDSHLPTIVSNEAVYQPDYRHATS